MMLKKNM